MELGRADHGSSAIQLEGDAARKIAISRTRLGGPAVAAPSDWEEAFMNLRSLFRVPTQIASPTKSRERMPSLIDVDVEFVDEPPPRGCSFETWTRARAWASED